MPQIDSARRKLASAHSSPDANSVHVAFAELNSVMNGLEVMRLTAGRHPDVRLIGLSIYNTREDIQAMLQAGAASYVDKAAGPDALLAAVRGFGPDERIEH